MRTVIASIFIFSLVFSAKSQPVGDFENLEKLIQNKINNKEIPSISIAVSQNGEILYANAFGKADIANDINATINTSYQIASLSKPLTATATMMLDEQKTIDIDADAESYMANLKFKNDFNVDGKPTIRNLLNHTSGLGTYFDITYSDENIKPMPFKEAFRSFGHLHHSPSVIYEYSNLGYGLLDYIISKNSGKEYRAFMLEDVFAPLKMNHSYVQEEKNKLANIQEAKKYDAKLNELPELLNNTPGAGNIYASVIDLIKFGNFNLQNNKSSILSDRALDEMHNYKDPKALFHYHNETFYGLGWYVKPDDNGHRVIWHEGGMMGASTTLKLIPDANIAIAVLINSSNRAACNEVLDELTKIVMPTYNPTPLNESTEIAAYNPVVEDNSFSGKWSGNISIDSLAIPISLDFNKDGSVEASYIDYTYKSYFTQGYPLPNKETLTMAISNQNSFIGLLLGTLPYENLRREFSQMLSLKLYKYDNKLSGTIVALAAAPREYYAYPFHIELKKEE